MSRFGVIGLCVGLIGAGLGCGSETAPSGAAPMDVGAGGVGALPPGTSGTSAVAATVDFCGVSHVAKGNCQTCHGLIPVAGAPMPLVTYEDFQQPSFSDPARKVYELVGERINLPTGDKRRMPPGSQVLAPVDLDTMNAWVAAGGPPAVGNCDTGTVAPPVAGEGSIVPPVMTIDGMDPDAPPAAMEEDVTCYVFKAHAQGNIAAGYPVGYAQDTYVQFEFAAPWTGTKYLRSVSKVLDNEAVTHHYLLYKQGGPGTDGAIIPGGGLHPGAELVHGWAPGGSDLMLPDDVSMEMPANGWLLEMHYNSNDPGAVDGSGVEVCMADNARPNNASISWLGTNNIGGLTATGTCDPKDTMGDITVLGFTPHMHTKGIHMKSVINRAAGGVETLHDLPFDFNYQIAYELDTPTIIKPGDTITTTCSYNAPANFGEGTGDEMCYFFVMYYPRLALTNSSIIGSFQGVNTCLGGAF